MLIYSSGQLVRSKPDIATSKPKNSIELVAQKL